MAQTLSFNGRRRVRKIFGKIPEVAEMPNLIEVQKASYDQFLMVDEPKAAAPTKDCRQFSNRFSRFPIFPAARCWSSCPTSSNAEVRR
jgi:DNA-directed RNA polymerase beta subunit